MSLTLFLQHSSLLSSASCGTESLLKAEPAADQKRRWTSPGGSGLVAAGQMLPAGLTGVGFWHDLGILKYQKHLVLHPIEVLKLRLHMLALPPCTGPSGAR
ncbi:hypothetical protein AV530_008247 [Patagioenas fasciata monilis]|uniref:Uncharacterized protein n=1 Tax=Patagioenas fasciata monilis TaxID=372326 RepID=A0A1V4KUU1_PATFA|nr:hypothetical protein AV530_008247 [Patagioenas fasciata monilis]